MQAYPWDVQSILLVCTPHSSHSTPPDPLMGHSSQKIKFLLLVLNTSQSVGH